MDCSLTFSRSKSRWLEILLIIKQKRPASLPIGSKGSSLFARTSDTTGAGGESAFVVLSPMHNHLHSSSELLKQRSSSRQLLQLQQALQQMDSSVPPATAALTASPLLLARVMSSSALSTSPPGSPRVRSVRLSSAGGGRVDTGAGGSDESTFVVLSPMHDLHSLSIRRLLQPQQALQQVDGSVPSTPRTPRSPPSRAASFKLQPQPQPPVTPSSRPLSSSSLRPLPQPSPLPSTRTGGSPLSPSPRTTIPRAPSYMALPPLPGVAEEDAEVAGVAPLPLGWTERTSRSSGALFYHHRASGETTRKRPVAMAGVNDAPPRRTLSARGGGGVIDGDGASVTPPSALSMISRTNSSRTSPKARERRPSSGSPRAPT